MFKEGKIKGVFIKDLVKFVDERGWLSELFREDEMESIDSNLMPVMSYISLTLPGVARGPHEHKEQTDHFCFIGPSNFKLLLWDNRPGSPTYGERMVMYVGEDNPKVVIVPPGIAHGYKNVGDRSGIVINFPNKLYAGKNKKEPVDEVRYENDPTSPFQME